MNATYRLQLTPAFTFADVQPLLPYFKRLGISHLYLSPITKSRPGSSHGYDVIDHNKVSEALGGFDGFEALRQAALQEGLSFILDFVPNHAGIGPHNVAWQDVLAFGPSSAYAKFFDINWQPLKPELRDKILLPFLGKPYGEVVDGSELGLVWQEGRFYASYYESRFALSPATYAEILEAALPTFERTEPYFDLKELWQAYLELKPEEVGKAEGLRTRLIAVTAGLDLSPALAAFSGENIHPLLERQFWRLAYWKTAGDEINYRRFFDINELVGLRIEDEEVFWDAHRLVGELVTKEGVEGLRIDHIDGLFDPHSYLELLRTVGAKQVWVEKILAPGEILPEGWISAGTTGYEFMNDVMGILTFPEGELLLGRTYRRFVGEEPNFAEEVRRSKRLVMETSLSGELSRLANELKQLAEADYHTRDFTLESIRGALTEITAAFGRYRTYLPYQQEEAREVIGAAVNLAKRRNPAFETSVYDFIEHVLVGEVREDLAPRQRAFIGRFQQYTAPVAAKGVEDTAFYRYLPLVALNEVGGEPNHFGLEDRAFHAHARFRAYRYPNNMLATATHDHKRGEDTRMRLIVLAELAELWETSVAALTAEAEKHRTGGLEFYLAPSKNDEYLFYQLLVALWIGESKEDLAERLIQYLQKAVREAKAHSSWLNPNESYESGVEAFVRGVLGDEKMAETVEPVAQALARYGFVNSLSQLILKLTTPGVPDIYRGSELLDLSLVDPDNRRPVDYARRSELLERLEPLLATPDPEALAALLASQDESLKLYLTAKLLRFRQAEPSLFEGEYRALQVEGERADHALAFTRESGGAALLVVMPRFPATLDKAGGWGETFIELPEPLAGRDWLDLLSGETFVLEMKLRPHELPLPFTILFSDS